MPKKRVKRHVIKIGDCYRVTSDNYISYYWVKGDKSKFTGLYTCESLSQSFDKEAFNVVSTTGVHSQNLQASYQISHAEYLKFRLKLGAMVHKYCDSSYAQRLKAFQAICEKAGIV